MVAEEGVRAVSFRAVARRAGVSHQAPYHHFGDHRGILLAIAREGFSGLAEAMRTAAEGAEGGPVEQLSAAGLAYLRFATDHPGHAQVMFHRPLFDSVGEPLPEAEATKHIVGDLAGRVVAAGGGSGVAPEVLAELCWSTTHGSAVLAAEGLLGTPDRSGSETTRADQGEHAARVIEALAVLLRGNGTSAST